MRTTLPTMSSIRFGGAGNPKARIARTEHALRNALATAGLHEGQYRLQHVSEGKQDHFLYVLIPEKNYPALSSKVHQAFNTLGLGYRFLPDRWDGKEEAYRMNADGVYFQIRPDAPDKLL